MCISIADDFSSHCSIHLWDPLQICWTITVSCFLSCLTVSFHFSSVLSPSSSSSSSLHSFFLSFIRFFSIHLLNSRLLPHPPPLLRPLPCSPSLTPSTPFLSPPLCHPSIKTPTDGPEPSAQATLCPSFFSHALHAKRRPIKVRLLSVFHSVVLLVLCVSALRLSGVAN